MAGMMGTSGYSRTKFSYPIIKDKLTGIYKCTLCSYKSLHRSSVRSHYAVHSSARPYACDMCEYEAKRLTDLKKHKVLKHGKNLTSLRSVSRQGFRSPVKRHSIVEAHALEFQASEEISSFTEDQHLSNLDALLEYHDQLDSQTKESCGDIKENPVVFPEQNPCNGVDSIQDTNDGCVAVTTQDGTVVVKPEPPEDYYKHSDDASPPPDSQNMDDADDNTKDNEEMNSSASASDKSSLSPSVSISFSESQAANSPSDIPSGSTASLLRRNLSGNTMLRCSNPNHSGARASPKVTSLNSECSVRNAAQSTVYSCYNKYPGQPDTSTQTRRSWQCSHCDIVYFDGAMYVMHMGLHHVDDPWKCNLCGQQFHDVYGFTSHFVNGHASGH